MTKLTKIVGGANGSRFSDVRETLNVVISGGPVTVILSRGGIVSDAVNGLEYGAAAPAGAVGQEAEIQKLIDDGYAAAAASGASGLRIVWDVAVALGREIYIGSNTLIECPHFTCGAIARANTFIHLLRVKGMDASMGNGRPAGVGGQTPAQALATQRAWGMFNPTYAGTQYDQFSRIFDTGFLLARNIAVTGGTWNGNEPQQASYSQGGPNAWVAADRNTGWPSVMQFNGVDGVIVRDVRCFLARQFVLWFSNCQNVLVDNVEIDNVNHRGYNNDAIHFAGPCRSIRVMNARVHCADDCVALNADDVLGVNTWGTPGVNWSCSGDITDVVVENLRLQPGRGGTVSWGAICFRSSVHRLSDVVIRGVTGRASKWAIWAPNFYSNGTSLQQVPGPGNIGHVVLDDVQIDLEPDYQVDGVVAWALNAEHLVVRNRYRRNAQPIADIFIAGGTTIQNLEVIDYAAYQAAGAVNNNQPALRIAGTVDSLTMRGYSRRAASLPVTAAPMVRLLTTANVASSNFPLGGVGKIGFADLRVDAQGIANVVEIAAGSSIETLQLCGMHRRAGGGAPIANAGTITMLLAPASTLAFVGAQAWSGNAPVTVGNYAEPVAGATVRYLATRADASSAYTTATAANDATGGYVDASVWCRLDSYAASAGVLNLVSRYTPAGNQNDSSWQMAIGGSGELLFFWYDPTGNFHAAGAGGANPVSSANPSGTTGIYLRGVLNVSDSAGPDAPGLMVGGSTQNGANSGGASYKAAAATAAFFWSADGITWTRFGSVQTDQGSAGIKANGTSGASPSVGANDGQTNRSSPPVGAFFKASVRDKTKVLFNPDFTAQQPGATSFQDTAPTPNTYALYNASIS